MKVGNSVVEAVGYMVGILVGQRVGIIIIIIIIIIVEARKGGIVGEQFGFFAGPSAERLALDRKP